MNVLSCSDSDFEFTCDVLAIDTSVPLAGLVAGVAGCEDAISVICPEAHPGGRVHKIHLFRSHDTALGLAGVLNGLHRELVTNSQVHADHAARFTSEVPPSPDYNAASEAAMLALTPAANETAYRTDTRETFEFTGADPTLIGDWTVIHTDGRGKHFYTLSGTPKVVSRSIEGAEAYDLDAMLLLHSLDECRSRVEQGQVWSAQGDEVIGPFIATLFGAGDVAALQLSRMGARKQNQSLVD